MLHTRHDVPPAQSSRGTNLFRQLANDGGEPGRGATFAIDAATNPIDDGNSCHIAIALRRESTAIDARFFDDERPRRTNVQPAKTRSARFLLSVSVRIFSQEDMR
jgi:hypothetical protein